MYTYIKGTLVEIHADHAIVDVQGIGYHIFIPLSFYTKMPKLHSQIHLHTSFIVREDSQRLFGFETKADKKLFEQLIHISGLGPKTAIAIIGQNDQISLEEVIHKKDVASLTKIPGIGKKTAERILIELDGKISPPKNRGNVSSTTMDAIAALISLGYKEKEATKNVSLASSEKPDASLEELIKISLNN